MIKNNVKTFLHFETMSVYYKSFTRLYKIKPKFKTIKTINTCLFETTIKIITKDKVRLGE